jgi:hypothetical protein
MDAVFWILGDTIDSIAADETAFARLGPLRERCAFVVDMGHACQAEWASVINTPLPDVYGRAAAIARGGGQRLAKIAGQRLSVAVCSFEHDWGMNSVRIA